MNIRKPIFRRKLVNSDIEKLIAHFGGQTKTAAALMVSQPTVSGWLRSEHGMSAKTAVRVESVTKGLFKAASLSAEYREMFSSDTNNTAA